MSDVQNGTNMATPSPTSEPQLPFVVVGPKGELLGANSAFADRMDSDPSDLVRSELWNYTRAEDVAWARQLNDVFHSLGRNAPDIRLRYCFRARDGRLVPSQVAIRVLEEPALTRGLYTVGVLLPEAGEPADDDIERHFAARRIGEGQFVARDVPMTSARRLVAEVSFRAATSPGARDEVRSPLSPREREVVALVGAGLRNAEIARGLFITEDAVKKRLQSVFAKLCLPNRAALAAWAVHSGLVDVPAIAGFSQ